jgi:nicotinamide mononucleotide transporter
MAGYLEKQLSFQFQNFQRRKRIAIILFILVAFVVSVYHYFGKFTWYAYVDTFITGIFFVGMWLMAKRKVENWIFWIIGDVISIPLYFSKGFTFTSFQYIVFTIVAILAI